MDEEAFAALGLNKEDQLSRANAGIKGDVSSTRHKTQKNRKVHIEAPIPRQHMNEPRLDTILRDPFKPTDPICILDAAGKIIKGAPIPAGTIRSSGPEKRPFVSQVQEVIGYGTRTKIEKITQHNFGTVQPWYFEHGLNITDIRELCHKSADLKTALRKRPVYLVTVVNVASGINFKRTWEYYTSKGRNIVNMSEPSKDATTITAEGSGDVIISYRLHTIKPVGWFWNRNYEVESYDPGKAGFMETGNENEEIAIIANEMSDDDLNEFIRASQSDELVREVAFWDEDGEEVALLGVDHRET